jgi:ribokinase
MFDIVTVGSATSDIFVSTKSKQQKIRKTKHEVCYPIGSKILAEQLYHSTGGGGTNTAVSFSRLGLKTGFLGVLGDDYNKDEILKELKKEKVKFLGKTKKGTTDLSVILIGIEKDRTILTHKGISDELKTKDIKKPIRTNWFYLSSLMGDSLQTAKQLISYAKKHKIKYAFNPSMYLAKKGIKEIGTILKGSDILVMNKEEAIALLKTKNKKINNLLKNLKKYSKLVIITESEKGAYCFDGKYKYFIKPKNVKLIETTGAGDAFASGFTAAIIKNKSIDYAMKQGCANATSVLTEIGAKNHLLYKKEAKFSIPLQNTVKKEEI